VSQGIGKAKKINHLVVQKETITKNFMPKHEQTITLNNIDRETAMAISYQAMKDLNWIPQYAGEEKLLGNTVKDWKNFPLQIMATVVNDNLTVTSEMTHGESFDMRGKNKKATAAFAGAFETAKKNMDAGTLENNKAAINTLRDVTNKIAEQEQQQAAEIDKAMNLSGSNLYVTYVIIALNVLVFILMAMDGAGIVDTNGLVHVKWGSNFTPLTLSGDWWRLFTNIFIHFGIIHLLMNMYCLYMAGIYLEPMLGKLKYTVAYVCTGITASVVSLWWHSDGVNSAGASGAIFGMYGLFLALLTTNLIPKQMRQPLLQSTAIFVVYNLVYGMKGGVDNSAHIGGLISGFIIGYIYVFAMRKEKQEQKLQWIIPVVIVLTIAGAYGYLEQHKLGTTERKITQADLKEGDYKDAEKFNTALQEVAALETKATAPLEDTTLTDPELKAQINSISYPLWEQAETKLKGTVAYEVSEIMHKKASKLLDYVALRKQELDIYLKIINAGSSAEFIRELNEARTKMNNIGAEIKNLQ
jgi:rhomboid protease GluP